MSRAAILVTAARPERVRIPGSFAARALHRRPSQSHPRRLAMARTARTYDTGYRDDVVAEAQSPAYQAYQILHWGFVASPVIAGLDKFASLLADSEKYLAPVVARHLPLSAHAFMM